MRFAALSLIAILVCAPISRLGGPAAVDPGLISLASAGSVRLLVYSVCSPEHCWSNPYLQWLSENRESVIATAQIQELAYGAAIGDISVEWKRTSPRFLFEVSPSHGGFEPYRATLTPGEQGSYTLAP
jgi:hypothetical protein